MAKIQINKVARPRGRNNQPLFPVGKSLVSIQWVEKTVSPEKGTPRLSVTLRGEAGPSKGMTIRQDLYLVDGALWKLADFCTAIGLPTDYEVDPDDARKLIDHFGGKELTISVGSESYKQDGRDREGRVVRSFGSLDAGIQARLEAEREARLGDGASEDDHLGEGVETDQQEADDGDAAQA